MRINFYPESPFTSEQEMILNEFTDALDSACRDCVCDNCIMGGFCKEHPDEPPGEIVRRILRSLGVKPES